MKNVLQVDDESFATEVRQARVPVLVDFYAPRCGPCQNLIPVLEALAAEYDGRLKVVKVNIESEPELAGQFRITWVPTLVLLNEGQVQDFIIGLDAPRALRSRLEPLLGEAEPAPRLAGFTGG